MKAKSTDAPTDIGSNQQRATTGPADDQALAHKPLHELFEADAGKGLEGTDKASFAIPFIAILQANSPQVDKLVEAKAGMFFNTVTEQLMREVLVVPCYYQRRYLRWAPRENGGGYRGDYDPIDVDLQKIEGLVQEDGRWYIGDDELKDTRNHYVLASQPGIDLWQPAVLSLASTQIKKSRRWMSRISGIELRNAANKPYNPPSYSHVYRLTTVKEENNQGSWYGVEIELVDVVKSPDLFAKAKAFYTAVSKGEVTVQPPPAAMHDEPSGAAGGPGEKF